MSETRTTLDRKIALVTGGSRGIGRAIALRLAEDGCAVVAFTYHSNEAGALDTAAEVEKRGAIPIPIAARLEDPASIDTLFETLDRELVARTGRANFDILVNNAGAVGSGTLATETVAGFDHIVAVNARAPFFILQAATTRLNDFGRVVNISSVYSTKPVPSAPVYSMTKAAINALTTVAAAELGPRGITVNAVAPGWTATDANADTRRQSPEIAEQVAGFTAAGRMAVPTDIAGVVSLFASAEGEWLTGQYVNANGRYLL